MRIAVIDLGFSSAKMVSYEVGPDKQFRATQQSGAKVRLGEGLNETGFLDNGPTGRTVDALKILRDIATIEKVEQILPVATSAVREAGNRTEFIGRVRHETGLEFRVLSAKEEALFSYAGAINALRIPTAVFFDLGGGSLEIVYAENFKIKKILSLPLGALRLMYVYGKGGGRFSKKGYSRMRKRVGELLPSRRELGLSRGARLVGVGGNLRAIARYDQMLRKYPFYKVHNYSIDEDSILSINRRLLKISPSNIAKIGAIGSGRAETVLPAACVIGALMEKLGFKEITVSTHGLRDGTLGIFLNNRDRFREGQVGSKETQEYVWISCQAGRRRDENLRTLKAGGLVDADESRILDCSLQIDELPRTPSLQSLFSVLIDEDSWLDHQEQLIMALSLVRSRNEGVADRLYSKYRAMLKRKHARIIQRVAASDKLLRILRRTGSELRLNQAKYGIVLRIRTAFPAFPADLLGEVVRKFQEAHQIQLDYAIEQTAHATETRVVRGEVQV